MCLNQNQELFHRSYRWDIPMIHWLDCIYHEHMGYILLLHVQHTYQPIHIICVYMLCWTEKWLHVMGNTKHSSQVVAPKSIAYRPSSHDWHSLDPFTGAYLPRLHKLHSVAPGIGEYRPIVQLLQVTWFLLREVPAKHCVHCDWPATFVVEPGSHSYIVRPNITNEQQKAHRMITMQHTTHMVAPATGLYRPIIQLTQS